MTKDRKRYLILIPTYNERENAEELCTRILDLDLEADILFMNDNSPDGTGLILEELARRHENVVVRHRRKKLGVGTAHREGILWAYEQAYDVLITMDCDFTHSPEEIPRLLDSAQQCDIVLGSRYLRQKSLQNWNVLRKTLTRFGHLLTRRLLRLEYDATGALAFTGSKMFHRGDFELVKSTGYSFLFESLYILDLNRYRIAEVPIKLPARIYGHSKMSLKEISKSVYRLFSLYLRQLFFKNTILSSEGRSLPRSV